MSKGRKVNQVKMANLAHLEPPAPEEQPGSPGRMVNKDREVNRGREASKAL